MARYGQDNERLKGSAARWQAGEAEMQQMLAKEAAAQEAATTTTGRSTEAIRRNAQARAEATELTERSARASQRATTAARAETEQIERLAAARRRAATAGASGAVRGTLDPLFGRAYGLTGGGAQVPTQYRLRQQLGIGTPRALRLQEALAAGAAPAGAAPVNVREAERGVVRAEQQLEQATRTLTNIKRRKSADDAEINAALSERDLARANLSLARERVVEAEQSASLHAQNVAAMRAEIAARERAAAAAAAAAEAARPGTALTRYVPPPVAPRPPSTELVRHPQLYGYGGVTPGITTAPYGPPPPPPQGVQEVNPFASGRPGRSLAQMAQQQAAARAATEQAAAALQLEAEQARVAGQQLGYLNAQTARVASATREAAVIQRLYSDEMHRHGALTAEFIQAAARGEVTVRQLGNEMLLTIGKFAGWTVAATAVYGVVRAIGVLGHGAIQAQSGVHTLDRVINNVDPSQATQAFADLSREFNVPIEVAVDAVYRMGQSFHSLPEAVTAARAALYSFKTGEVDVATSTGNLIAITRGFGLSSNELLSVYNQINQAQNLFGVRIADTEKGIGNAAGTFRNAGGDFTYMLSLFVAINKATAQTGTVVGTALNRAVTQFRTPKHRSILEAMGVDYDPANLQKTLESAFAVAQRAGTTGQQRRQLAEALFGNQYARLLEPVLNDPRLLRQAQRRLDPSRQDVQTSAARELAKVLAQADEQLGKIGNTLQRIGAQMQQAGLFTFAGIMLQGINHVLGALEQMLKVFNLIPSPIRESLSLLLEMAVAMKVLGRFGVGQRLQTLPGIGGLVDPGNRLRQQALSDQNAIVAAATRQRETEANALAGARGTQRFNLLLRTPIQEDITRQLARPGLGEERRAELIAEQNAIRKATLADANRADIAERRVILAQQLLAEDEANLAAVKAANARNIEATLAQRQIQVTPLPGTRAPGVLPTPVTGREFLQQSEAQHGAIVSQSARAERVMSSMQVTLGSYAAGLAATSAIGGRVSGATERVIATTGRAVTSIGRVRERVGNLGTRLGGLAAALGPLDYALIGLIGYGFVAESMDKAARDSARAQQEMEKFRPTSRGEAQATLERQRQRVAGRGTSGLDIIGDIVHHPLRYVDPFFAATEIERRKTEAADYAANVQEQEQIEQNQREARRRGRPQPQRFAGDIVADLNRTAQQARAGRVSQRDLNRALERYAVEIKTAYAATPETARTMNEAFANAQRLAGSVDDFAAALRKLDDKGLAAAFAASASELKTYGANSERGRRALDELEREYTEAARRSRTGDAAAVANLAKAQETFFGAINDAAEAVLQEGLAGARTEAQRQRAFRNAQQLLTRRSTVERTFTVGGERGFAEAGTGERRYRDAATRRNALLQRQQRQQQAYEDAQQGRQIQLALAQSYQVDPIRNARLAIDSAAEQVRAARRRYGEGSRQYRQALTTLNQAHQQQAQALLAGVQAEGSVAEARAAATGDPVAIARAAANTARNVLNFMRQNRSKFDPGQITQAVAAYLNAITQIGDAVRQNALDLLQLRGQIAVARAHGDPVAAAGAAGRFARQEAAQARNPKERLQATLDQINANNDYEDAIRSREQARFDYLKSLTSDPQRQANLDVRQAAAGLRGLTPGTEAYFQAQARYHETLRARRDLRLQSREDDIDFELQMERISTDDAIRRYQQLLKLHNLTKAQRREILLKIHQLRQQQDQDEQGFALRVGDVKLPTIYDVRRAISEGRRGGDRGAQVNFRNTAKVDVHVNSGADVKGVFEELDRQLGGTVASQLRSAGLT